MNRLLILFLLILASCSPKLSFKKLPEGPIKHQLIVLGKVSDGVRVRGFSGATPPKTTITCAIGEDGQKVQSSQDGSFDMKVATTNNPKYGELVFETAGKEYQANYEIKDLDKALDKVAKDAFATGSDIASVSFANDKALILSSEKAALSIYDLSPEWTLEKYRTIVLNPEGKVALGARSAVGFKTHALVPLFNTHELLLLDLDKNQILSSTRLFNTAGEPFKFTNDPALAVNKPIDADGTGKKTLIKDSFAQNAEAVFAIDDEHFLASFINSYQFSDDKNKSVMGPGIIALLNVKNGKVVSQNIKVLEYKNPMYFVAEDEKNIWLTCTGPWDLEGTTYKSSDAALLRLTINDAKDGIAITRQIPLKDFSPGKPALVSGKIIIPHSEQNEVAVIDQNATELTKADIKPAKYHRAFSFSFAVPWHDDIVMLGDNSGSLVAYSLKEEFFPFPFVAPIRIEPEATIAPPRIHDLQFRHQALGKALVDLVPGYTAWATSFDQGKIFPLDFLTVFGP